MTSTATPAGALDISAAPRADQHIAHNGKNYTTIREGLAHILVPAESSTVPQTSPQGGNQLQSVFYNPIQQFNRDLSVLAIAAYGEELQQKLRERPSSKKSKKRKRENDNGEGSRKQVALDATSNHDLNPTDTTNGETGAVEDAEAVVRPQAETVADARGESASATPAIANGASGPATNDASEKMQQPQSTKFKFTILDALSATGLRALRYAHEIPFTTSVTANDLLPAATASIDLNVEHNKLSDKIKSLTGNAITHMYSFVGDDMDAMGRPKPSKKYNVIDLDPYGTAAPFLDAAIQAVRSDGGLLCVTCTDAGVWASNGYPEKAYSLYGGLSVKGLWSHEAGLRLILNSIATSAARYGLVMEPLLSLSIDFYARVFVKIRKSPADVKFLAGKTMVVYNCDSGCGAWTTQLLAKNKIAKNKSGNGYFYKHVFAAAPSGSQNCEHCGMKTHLAGPMYGGPLHSAPFIRRILDNLPNVSKETYSTTERIEGMLTMALEENLEPGTAPPTGSSEPAAPSTLAKEGEFDPAAVDHYPFFFIPSALSKVIHCVTPHENAVRGALRHLGYRVTRSHTKAGSIKTDAPWSVIWRVMREWVRQKSPIKEGAVKEGTPGYQILGLGGGKKGEEVDVEKLSAEEAKATEVVFDEVLGKDKDPKKLVRYQLNPRENWGPMNRAKGH